jgi:hypothetical protein
MADQPCTSLAKYVGSYKQISKSCDAYWFGPTLTVTPYDETRPPKYSGYWLDSGAAGFGPTTLGDGTDLDKCTVQGNEVTVEICGNSKDNTCLPMNGRISYVFSGSQVHFMADGCSAVFVKN